MFAFSFSTFSLLREVCISLSIRLFSFNEWKCCFWFKKNLKRSSYSREQESPPVSHVHGGPLRLPQINLWYPSYIRPCDWRPYMSCHYWNIIWILCYIVGVDIPALCWPTAICCTLPWIISTTIVTFFGTAIFWGNHRPVSAYMMTIDPSLSLSHAS